MTETAAFSYARSVAPMLWMLIGISSVELVVVHFLLYFWSPVAALILSLLTLGGIFWMIALLRSFRRLPVLVERGGVTMRVGTLIRIQVPAEQLNGSRLSFTGEDVKQPGVLNLGLLAYPNVLLDLHPPLARKRGPIQTIGHRLDDPASFAAAVEALLAGSGPH